MLNVHPRIWAGQLYKSKTLPPALSLGQATTALCAEMRFIWTFLELSLKDVNQLLTCSIFILEYMDRTVLQKQDMVIYPLSQSGHCTVHWIV